MDQLLLSTTPRKPVTRVWQVIQITRWLSRKEYRQWINDQESVFCRMKANPWNKAIGNLKSTRAIHLLVDMAVMPITGELSVILATSTAYQLSWCVNTRWRILASSHWVVLLCWSWNIYPENHIKRKSSFLLDGFLIGGVHLLSLSEMHSLTKHTAIHCGFC